MLPATSFTTSSRSPAALLANILGASGLRTIASTGSAENISAEDVTEAEDADLVFS
jgi:hypothetical protein